VSKLYYIEAKYGLPKNVLEIIFLGSGRFLIIFTKVPEPLLIVVQNYKIVFRITIRIY